MGPQPTEMATNRNKPNRVVVNKLRNPTLGRRTGQNVVGDKIIRVDQKGRECFADYFSDDDSDDEISTQDSVSEASVKSFVANRNNRNYSSEFRRKRASKSITLSRIEVPEDSTLSEPKPMSPFSPTIDESVVSSGSPFLSPGRQSLPLRSYSKTTRKNTVDTNGLDCETRSPRSATPPALIKPVPKYGYVLSSPTHEDLKENAPPDDPAPFVIISDVDNLAATRVSRQGTTLASTDSAPDSQEFSDSQSDEPNKGQTVQPNKRSPTSPDQNDLVEPVAKSDLVQSPDQQLDKSDIDEDQPLQASKLISHDLSVSGTQDKLAEHASSIAANTTDMDADTYCHPSGKKSKSVSTPTASKSDSPSSDPTSAPPVITDPLSASQPSEPLSLPKSSRPSRRSKSSHTPDQSNSYTLKPSRRSKSSHTPDQSNSYTPNPSKHTCTPKPSDTSSLASSQRKSSSASRKSRLPDMTNLRRSARKASYLKNTIASPQAMQSEESSQSQPLELIKPMQSTPAGISEKTHTPQTAKGPLSSSSKLHLGGLQNGSITFSKSRTPEEKIKSQKVKCQLSVLFMEKETADTVVAAIQTSNQKDKAVVQAAEDDVNDDDDNFVVTEMPQKYMFNLQKFDVETNDKKAAVTKKPAPKNKAAKGRNKTMNPETKNSTNLTKNKPNAKQSVANKTVATMSTSVAEHQEGVHGSKSNLRRPSPSRSLKKKAHLLDAGRSALINQWLNQESDDTSEKRATTVRTESIKPSANVTFHEKRSDAEVVPDNEQQMVDVMAAAGLHTSVVMNNSDDSLGRKRKKATSVRVPKDNNADKEKKTKGKPRKVVDKSRDTVGGGGNDTSLRVKKTPVRRRRSTNAAAEVKASKPVAVVKTVKRTKRSKISVGAEEKSDKDKSVKSSKDDNSEQDDTCVEKLTADSCDTETTYPGERSETEASAKQDEEQEDPSLSQSKGKSPASVKSSMPVTRAITKLAHNVTFEIVAERQMHASDNRSCAMDSVSTEEASQSTELDNDNGMDSGASAVDITNEKIVLKTGKTKTGKNKGVRKKDHQSTQNIKKAAKEKLCSTSKTVNVTDNENGDATQDEYPDCDGSSENNVKDVLPIGPSRLRSLSNTSQLQGRRNRPRVQDVKSRKVAGKQVKKTKSKEPYSDEESSVCESGHKSDETLKADCNTDSEKQEHDWNAASVSSYQHTSLPKSTEQNLSSGVHNRRSHRSSAGINSKSYAEFFEPVRAAENINSTATGRSKGNARSSKISNISEKATTAKGDSRQKRNVENRTARDNATSIGTKRISRKSHSPSVQMHQSRRHANSDTTRDNGVAESHSDESGNPVEDSFSDSLNRSGYISNTRDAETVKPKGKNVKRSVADTRAPHNTHKTPNPTRRRNSEVLKSLLKSHAKRKLTSQCKIYVPQNDENAGVRRSHRQRVAPMEYWRNQRVKYTRKSTGFVIAGILDPPSSDTQKEARVSPKRKKTHALASRKRVKQQEDNSDHVVDCPDDMSEGPIHPVAVYNPERDEDVFVDCFGLHHAKTYYGDDSDGKYSDILFCKSLHQRAFHAGEVILRVGACKPLQNTLSDTLVFKVDEGQLVVRIHQTSCLVAEGDFFFVPSGNVYSLRNTGEDIAKLTFFQLRGDVE